MSTDFIPVIDIARLRDGSDRAGVASALLAASRDPGFLYVTGHGIPDAVIEAARSEAFAFFRSPPADKARVAVSAHHRGWLAEGGARMRDDMAPDAKESFIFGLAADTADDHPLRGPNRWPCARPSLQEVGIAWFGQATAVAHDLLRGFALALGLEADFFLRKAEPALSRASFVWYPPQRGAIGDDVRFGVGPHTDFGVLTVLCQDTTGGLEVQRANGDWIAAPPIDGTLVVNVADLLSRWTHGICRSTPHRVMNRSGRERLSLVLAFDPAPDTQIDSRDVVGQEVQDQLPPIRCGDYLLARFGQAFAYRDAATSAIHESSSIGTGMTGNS